MPKGGKRPNAGRKPGNKMTHLHILLPAPMVTQIKKEAVMNGVKMNAQIRVMLAKSFWIP